MKNAAMVLLALLIVGCSNNDDDRDTSGAVGDRDFKQDMRDFVIGISQTAKAVDANFFVIPQNGIELVTINGEEDGAPATAYLNAIDANGQEDLLFGYDNDDQATPAETVSYLKSYLDISKNSGNTILVTDYVSTPSKVTTSYQNNGASGYISYAAPERALNVIPTSAPHNENAAVVTSLPQAKNFLYLINPENYTSKQAFINAVCATNYDALIMDLYLEDATFTAAEIAQLKNKANGGKRVVICYMSIGEAEDYRYYWDASWNNTKPSWIAAENPDWPGNYKVQYWNADWQGIVYKNSDSYLSKILAAGFDGVYLDIIDAFEYFE